MCLLWYRIFIVIDIFWFFDDFFFLFDRDVVVKVLYSRLFIWLVERINNIICRVERDKNIFLVVFDIFGFEVFKILMCFLNMWFLIYFVYIVNIF